MDGPYKIKIAFLGESSVGKTSIIERYMQGCFQQHSVTTTGSFKSKVLLANDGRTRIELNIWDTAGQEIYRSLTPLYYRDADAVVVVYDVTSDKSYKNLLLYWVNEVRSKAPESCLLTIVGNKVDMALEFAIDPAEIRAVATKNNAKLFFTSAKDSINITELFKDIAVRRFPHLFGAPSPSVPSPTSSSSTSGVRLRADAKKRNKKSCC